MEWAVPEGAAHFLLRCEMSDVRCEKDIGLTLLRYGHLTLFLTLVGQDPERTRLRYGDVTFLLTSHI